MLVIRTNQMDSFKEYTLKGFENRMVEYLSERFPNACAHKGEAAVRESVRNGIDLAGSHGITSEYDVARYIHIMYMFSEDFATSLDTPWAAEILEDRNLGPTAKMDLIWERGEQEPPVPKSEDAAWNLMRR